MLDLNNLDASRVILSDIQEKIFGIEKAIAIFCFQKTKPTQHSVRELRALGLTPHLLTSHCTELTGLSKKPMTLSWEDNNCSTMEISGLEIGWGQLNNSITAQQQLNINSTAQQKVSNSLGIP
ncbi:hypothetical protein Fmac_015369 [Flemingia macrophylla]|uniref:Uncharacterized protein n=1 Tax=Flemingia macrophylla TaxID=520843 RepID=A0ABD1MEF1_9FABA